tara:strand:+ start:102 stop:1007 length:906 start_codon:yes stop_codon:yes gene_type:complete
MAFLDNSGDIILDAVLTDTGRMRMAKGDGSFRIVSFAFGDDEIDYSNYTAVTASGYEDLQILQTPILEAYTNNASSMKSKLITIADTNLLYLPVVKLNEVFSNDVKRYASDNVFVVAVDKATARDDSNLNNVVGIFNGENLADAKRFRLDQGIDNSNIAPSTGLAGSLTETQYIIEIDNRFGSIYSPDGSAAAAISYIDDDQIASYYLTLDSNPSFITSNTVTDEGDAAATQTITGARGTIIQFKIKSSIDLQSSTNLFTKLGSTRTIETVSCRIIDTFVRVTGQRTGYRVDIPVRFIKKV